MVSNSSRPNPYGAFNFEVVIEGVLSGGFQEVTGLDSAVKTEPYQEGGQNAFQHQLLGPAEVPPNIVLKRGLTNGLEMWFWYQKVTQDVVVVKESFPTRAPVIIFLTNQNKEKLHWWLIRSAFPVKWSGPKLQADASGSSAIAFETLELAHTGIYKQGPKETLSDITSVVKTFNAR
jgi:phage tail-like protein